MVGRRRPLVGELHDQPGAGGAVVSKHADGPVELTGDDVDVAVAVEVAEDGAAATARLPEEGADRRVVHRGEAFPPPDEEQGRLFVVRIHRVRPGFGVDVAIEDEQVLVAVVIEVVEPAGPAQIGAADHAQTELHGPVVEERAVEVQVQRVRIAGEVGREDVRAGVPVDVADSDPHGGLVAAVEVGREAAVEADVLERQPATVAKEPVGHRVIAHEDLRFAVAVQVQDGDPQAEAGLDCEAPRSFGDVAEGAIAEVLVEHVGLRGEPVRAGENLDALVARAGGWIGQVELEVVDRVQVEIAVAVEIAEGGARAPAGIADPGGFGDVGEPRAAGCGGVPQEHVGPVAGDVKVVEAVAVEVAHRGAHGPPSDADPQRFGHVAEPQPAEVLVQPAPRPAFRVPERGAVGDEEIEVAVSVMIDERQTAAVDLEDLRGRLVTAGHHHLDPAVPRDVLEPQGLPPCGPGRGRRCGVAAAPEDGHGDQQGPRRAEGAHPQTSARGHRRRSPHWAPPADRVGPAVGGQYNGRRGGGRKNA